MKRPKRLALESGPVSARAALWMIVVGLISMCAFAALSAYAPDLRTGADGGGHALSKSAVGFAGAVELLQASGVPVMVSRNPSVQGAAGLLVLTPQPAADPKAVDRFRFGGLRLIVLPKWAVAPDPVHRGWIEGAGLLPVRVAAAPLLALSPTTLVRQDAGATSPVLRQGRTWMFRGEQIPSGPVQRLQTISGPDWIPVLVDQHGRAVVAVFHDRPILVLADPDLMNTHGLADPATAQALARMLRGFGVRSGPVIFDVTLAGFVRGPSLLRLVVEPPLVGATLCLAAALLLAGLHAASRFGPTTRSGRVLAFGKQALADNSAALVRMAGREARMATPYAQLSRDAVARAVGAPRDLDGDQLEALLDRMGAERKAAERFSGLAAEARAVRTHAELMRSARRIFDWKLEMTRERR